LADWDGSKLCISSPYQQFWMEYHVVDGTVGAWFQRWSTAEWLSQSGAELTACEERLLGNVRWVLTADIFRSSIDEPGTVVSSYGLASMVDYDGMAFGCGLYSRVPDYEIPETLRARVLAAMASTLYPMLFAMSYVGHSENLEEVVPTRQQRRFTERKGLTPPYTYHVVKVKAFEEFRQHYILHGGGTHATPRLHDVRANWACYTPAKPLFGKVAGMVWRRSHLKGNPERGAVEKDYEVVAPFTA
jgi:hypothetical protein